MKMKYTAVLLGFFLLSCFEYDLTVYVNKDGTGTIVQTGIVLKPDLPPDMKPKEKNQDEIKKDELKDIEKAKAAALEYGEGVHYESFSRSYAEKGEKTVVVYSFSDINKVKLRTDLKKSNPGQDAKNSSPYVTFDFQNKNDLSRLKINLSFDEKKNTKENEAKESEAKHQPDAQSQELAKKIFKDMRMSLNIKLKNKIKNTNSHFIHEDQTGITIYDIQFKKLLDLPEDEKKNLNELGMADLMKLTGIKFEKEKIVTIEF